jgi:hypothetical protein
VSLAPSLNERSTSFSNRSFNLLQLTIRCQPHSFVAAVLPLRKFRKLLEARFPRTSRGHCNYLRVARRADAFTHTCCRGPLVTLRRPVTPREAWERTYSLKINGIGFASIQELTTRLFKLNPKEVPCPGKDRNRVAIQSILCYFLVRELGTTVTAIAEGLKIG